MKGIFIYYELLVFGYFLKWKFVVVVLFDRNYIFFELKLLNNFIMEMKNLLKYGFKIIFYNNYFKEYIIFIK